MLQSLKNFIWKMEIAIWKSECNHPTWHGIITVLLSFVMAVLVIYVMITISPWFGLSINWNPTDTHLEKWFFVFSLFVGAFFFTFIISFLNAERIGKVIRKIQEVKASQLEKFEITNFFWESLKKYPHLEFLGFDIDMIGKLRNLTKETLNLEITDPDTFVSYRAFKEKASFCSNKKNDVIANFEKIVNELKEKVERANEVSEALRKMGLLWFLDLITGEWHGKDKVFSYQNHGFHPLLQYLDKGGDKPTIYMKSSSRNIFEEIEREICQYQQEILAGKYSSLYENRRLKSYPSLSEWLREWKELP